MSVSQPLPINVVSFFKMATSAFGFAKIKLVSMKVNQLWSMLPIKEGRTHTVKTYRWVVPTDHHLSIKNRKPHGIDAWNASICGLSIVSPWHRRPHLHPIFYDVACSFSLVYHIWPGNFDLGVVAMAARKLQAGSLNWFLGVSSTKGRKGADCFAWILLGVTVFGSGLYLVLNVIYRGSWHGSRQELSPKQALLQRSAFWCFLYWHSCVDNEPFAFKFSNASSAIVCITIVTLGFVFGSRQGPVDVGHENTLSNLIEFAKNWQFVVSRVPRSQICIVCPSPPQTNKKFNTAHAIS